MEVATMCGWWWSNDGVAAPWYALIFGPLSMLAFIVLTVVIIAWVLRASGLGWHASAREKTALDILKDRFARGEIDRAEFDERKKILSGA
jgi:putative membrane protein